jgi:hypothetical protein
VNGPKEVFYDNKIMPLMTQLIALCKEAKINFAASFSVPDEEGALFVDSIIPADPEDLDGMKRLSECNALWAADSDCIILVRKGVQK